MAFCISKKLIMVANFSNILKNILGAPVFQKEIFISEINIPFAAAQNPNHLFLFRAKSNYLLAM